jgi:Rrf2 family protein
MFSQTAEYALRAVVALADSPEGPLTTHQIAERTKVPANYLAKVLQSLSRAGIVSSQRGLGGGSVLARPAAQISVYEVIESVDPIHRIRTCPLDIATHGSNLCPLHRRLDNAAAQVEAEFRATTIEELLHEPTNSPPLCGLVKPGRGGLTIQTKPRTKEAV